MQVQTAGSITDASITTPETSISVIDMNDWYAQDTNRRNKFIEGLDTAFRTVGFVAVMNPEIDMDILNHGYEQAATFFDSPKKMELNDPKVNGQRGYVPGETAKGSEEKDLKEFLHIGREYSQEQLNRLKYPKNIWPASGALQPSMLALYAQLEKFMNPFLEAIAEALQQPADFLSGMTREGDCLLRALHYFPTEKGKEVGKEHTDIDLIAILPRATCEGLQVQLTDGRWISAKVPDGAFIINAGDMLEAMTNGFYKSARHRVVSPGGDMHRYSMVLFVHPRDDDQVGPLAKYITLANGEQRYPFGTRWQYLTERLIELGLATIERAQEFAESGFMERRVALGKPSMPCIKRLKEMGIQHKLLS